MVFTASSISVRFIFGLVGLRVLKAARGVRSGVVAAFDVRLAAAMADTPVRSKFYPL